MADAYRDGNDVPTLIASSNVDGQTPIRLYADPVTHRLLVDFASGSALALLTATGTVDGSNATFTFTKAPSIIVVDQGRMMQKTSSDGTANWTGTTNVTLTIAPTFDIYGLG